MLQSQKKKKRERKKKKKEGRKTKKRERESSIEAEDVRRSDPTTLWAGPAPEGGAALARC